MKLLKCVRCNAFLESEKVKLRHCGDIIIVFEVKCSFCDKINYVEAYGWRVK